MLGKAFEQIPGEVEPVMRRVRAFDPHHRAQRLRIVAEAPVARHRIGQRRLARMAERRVAEIMRKAQRLGQILVEPERAGDHSADLRDFETMGQAGAVMIAIGRDEHLRLGLQPAEAHRMDDPVAVALESAARPAPLAVIAATCRAAPLAWPMGSRIGGIGGAGHHGSGN